ncbi:DUF3017 domain-containing protein [Streptomyces chengbuensis]|uniref:DUF3017 domain-containing protein n=1 Tax=Streptomyces TaxID=1883 RepID=UPI0025B595DE|nr:DUF3017 domain-containing protein [Streptomyces sp. HUAS CB01]WJY52104.1 DUF3017 domain-containing protein [Streptomyces sp. HUAS CB01]
MDIPDNHAESAAGRRPARASGASRGPQGEPAGTPGTPGTSPSVNGADGADRAAGHANGSRPEASGEPAARNGAGPVGREAGTAGVSAPAADRTVSDGSAERAATNSSADDADRAATTVGAAAAAEEAEPGSPPGPAEDRTDTAERAASRSRRPPAVTRDTARPEGGGRAAPGDAPAPARQWPLLTVLGLAALGLLIVGVDPFDQAFRVGTMLVGLALLTGAALRRALPSVGMLAVRSRFTDMVTYGLLGTVIVLLALMVQPQPWLEIPFLEEAVRFTVR